MALKDLITSKKKITDALLEKILKSNVELMAETKGVNLTGRTLKFSNKTKVLLYLCGKKAWELIDKSQEKYKTSISELVQALGILNSTMRSLLKGLRDDGLVFSEKGKYFVLPKGVLLVQNLIERESKKEKPVILKKYKRERVIVRPDVINKIREAPLSPDYVEEILPIIESSKYQDRYLLALHITKEKVGINGLMPSEINFFLSEPPLNFPRMYTSNVSRDLGKMRKLVTAYGIKGGIAFEYRLTTFGERRVKELIEKHKEISKKE